MTKEPEDKTLPVTPSNSIQQSLSAAAEALPPEVQTEEDVAELDDATSEVGEWVDIPEPPDGGWGWMIVIASFLSNMVVDGITYTFGIFFMEFVKYFNAPKGKTAWVGSLLSGFYLSVGPLVSALTNRFGCRPVCMAGSIIACFAFLLSTLAPNVDVLMVTYGMMGGVGLGLIYLPAIVSVGYYFSTKRAFATGIAVCGSGVGAFIFAPLCQKLLEIYGWKGALVILAGFTLNCMVFGALMRPLNATVPKQKPLLQRIAEEKERRRLDSLCDSQFILIQHADGTVEKKPKLLLNMEPGVHSTLYLDQFGKSPADTPVITLSPIEEAHKSPASSKEDEMEEKKPEQQQPTTPDTSYPPPVISNGGLAIREIAKRKGLVPINGAMKLSLSNITVNNDLKKHNISMKYSSSGILCPGHQNNNYLAEEMWKRLQEEQMPLDGNRRSSLKRNKKDYTRPLYRKDIFYSGSIVHLPEYIHSQKDIRSYVASVISIPREGGQGNVEKPRPHLCPTFLKLPKSMTDTIDEMLDFSLLKNRIFLLICISNVIGMVGFPTPFIYLTDSATTKGISPDKAAFLLSVIGITNTIGRLIFGWLSDRPNVSALFVNNVCLFLSGVCIFIMPFCQDYVSIVLICVVFGLFVSAYICLTSIILVNLLGLDKLTNAFGLLSLFRGGSCMIGPPLAGSISDWTGNYNISFYVSGILLIISSLITFAIPCLAKNEAEQPTCNLPTVIEEPEEEAEAVEIAQVESVV
ncbi:monocarboxylate transporter 12-B-like isoform X2 [Centruroides vittatus]